MSAFLATLHDLRYVIATALLIWAAAWTIAKVYAWSCAEVDRMVGEALDSISLDDLMDGDDRADINGYPRAGLERLLHEVDHFDVDDALALANDHTFDTTLGEIRALPETRTA